MGTLEHFHPFLLQQQLEGFFNHQKSFYLFYTITFTTYHTSLFFYSTFHHIKTIYFLSTILHHKEKEKLLDTPEVWKMVFHLLTYMTNVIKFNK